MPCAKQEACVPFGVRSALPLEEPPARPTAPIHSKEQTFPFLVFILAAGDEGRGTGFKTSRKRLFVWLALFMPTRRRAGRQAWPSVPPPPPPPGQVAVAPGGLYQQEGKGGTSHPLSHLPPSKGPQQRGGSARGTRSCLGLVTPVILTMGATVPGPSCAFPLNSLDSRLWGQLHSQHTHPPPRYGWGN